MTDARTVTLGSVGSFSAGYGFPIPLQGRTAGDFPFAKVGDISSLARAGLSYIAGAANYVDNADVATLKAKPLPKGSIVFAKIGEAIRQNFRLITRCEMLVDNNVMGFTPDPASLDTKYALYFFRQKDLYGLTSSTTVPSLRKSTLESITLRLPSLAKQKRIAAILDAADALRAKRRESIEQLDSLVQATFLEMFGDPVTNPRKWPITCLRDIANDTFRNGLSPSTKGSVAGQVLTLGAITSGEFLFAERKSACFDRPAAEVQTLSERTFLICRGNGNRDLVGIGAFPDRTSADVCFPDTMIGATPDCGIVHGRYLHRVWNSRSVRTQVESMARTTNGTYKVNQQMLASVAMPLPPLDLQTRFASIVESIEQQKARLKVHLAELDTLFASLQSRAFNGELMA